MKLSIQNKAKQIRFFLQIILMGALFSLGIFSCFSGAGTGGGASSAGPGVTEGQGSGAAPQTPPSTVSLDPGCEKGAKPDENGKCKGEPLPPPIKPCSSNLIVMKDQEAGVWWCGCPADTTEVNDSENNNLRTCVCSSGQNLLVNTDKGEALGCPVANSRAPALGAEAAAPQAPCRPGLVLLMPVIEGHPNFCGCPVGTDHIYPPGGGASTGCRCPSGATVQVDPNTSEMVGACPPVELNNERVVECNSPCFTIDMPGRKPICNCPVDLKK